MSRAKEYQTLHKLKTAISRTQYHFAKAQKCLESEHLKIYPSAQCSHAQIDQGLAFASLHLSHWSNFSIFLLKEYETSKPDRFTPEQLKEMHYLLEKGLSVQKLAKNYNCAFDTMKKYLKLTKEKTQ